MLAEKAATVYTGLPLIQSFLCCGFRSRRSVLVEVTVTYTSQQIIFLGKFGEKATADIFRALPAELPRDVPLERDSNPQPRHP